MSIELLEHMAAQTLPLDCLDDEQRDGLLVLRSAGLIAALLVRTPATEEPAGPIVVRVLAITPAGRRLLRRAKGAGAPCAAENTILDARSG
ncbi:MAG: hypothetical protein ACRYGA_12050 [Janthinobacterium lividum]